MTGYKMGGVVESYGELAVSKKSKKRQPKPQKPPAPARFSTGTQVRVKQGITDPDLPDIPLGGWSGTILDFDDKSTPLAYRIEWDHRTLDQMHPTYRQRCERDGLDLETMWLHEDEIEPASGGLVPIEQPTQIVTRPLTSDQDDRILAIFGLTSDDPLPMVDEEHLAKYHRHLAERMKLPFRASYEEETGPYFISKRKITVMSLLASEEADDEEGLLCEASDGDENLTLPLAALLVWNGRNRQLIADYRHWLWSSAEVGELRFVDEKPARAKALLTTLVMTALVCAFYAAALGAAWASLDGAAVAIKVGAILLALVGGLLGHWYGAFFGIMNGISNGPRLVGVIGAILGALLGGMLGAMMIAFIGALVGALVGGILAKIMAEKMKPPTFRGVVGGAMLGVMVQAWLHDADEALIGIRVGAVIGAVVGAVVLLGIVVTVPGKKTRR
jgi:hypothetical protein